MSIVNRSVPLVLTVMVLASPLHASAAQVSTRSADPSAHAPALLDGSDCGALLLNADGGYENAVSWEYGQVVPPFYGAFAECYSGDVGVCAVVIDYTQLGSWTGKASTVFVWADAGGVPGDVLCMKTTTLPSPLSWPGVSRAVVQLDTACCVSGSWWVGVWGDWPNDAADYFVAADNNGPGGCPRTCIAPGLGFPTGWIDASTIWPMQALGLGAEWNPCVPVPSTPRTWGRVKALYR